MGLQEIVGALWGGVGGGGLGRGERRAEWGRWGGSSLQLWGSGGANWLTRLRRPAPSPIVSTHELSLARILGREGGAVRQWRGAGSDPRLR